MKRILTKYLERRGADRPLLGVNIDPAALDGAVVIPSLAEADTLPATLASLASNPAAELERTLIVIVVNNRRSEGKHAALPAEIENNRRTLAWLADFATETPLRLAWIDASSPGNELPDRGGVGLARKIGCDSCMRLLHDSTGNDEIQERLQRFRILHLDGDTLVESNYLPAVRAALESSTAPGLSIAFRHQPADTAEGQRAIDQYEAFLQHYVDGLNRAGSPYAFHTVGSSMACTAEGYLKVGGMPAKRQAGEDFYFLQELAKNGGVLSLTDTVLHPSARSSRRVPFGTGHRIRQALEFGQTDFFAYDPRTFDSLGNLLQTVTSGFNLPAEAILAALTIDDARHFLEERGFRTTWDQFQQQHATPEARLKAFHRWFDGFVSLKFIHWLTDQKWPRIPLEMTSHFGR